MSLKKLSNKAVAQELVEHFKNDAWPLDAAEYSSRAIGIAKTLLQKEGLALGLVEDAPADAFSGISSDVILTLNPKVFLDERGNLYDAIVAESIHHTFLGYL